MQNRNSDAVPVLFHSVEHMLNQKRGMCMGLEKHVPRITKLLVSLLCAVGILLAGVLLLAFLTTKDSLQEVHLDYGIMLIIMIASALGSTQFLRMQKSIAAALLFTCSFWALLLAVTGLFFDGMYHGVAVTLLLILGGAMLPALTGRRTKSRQYSRRSFMRHG
jgi:hypothetical protein